MVNRELKKLGREKAVKIPVKLLVSVFGCSNTYLDKSVETMIPDIVLMSSGAESDDKRSATCTYIRTSARTNQGIGNAPAGRFENQIKALINLDGTPIPSSTAAFTACHHPIKECNSS